MLIGIWRRDWQKARHDDARCRRRYWKSGPDLTRYFPEVLTAALMLREKHFVMNGELVVPVGGRFSFDDLLQRIHPAASRVKKLAEQALALFLAFDLLKKGRTDLAAMSLRKRWPLLEDFAENDLPSVDLFRLSPASQAERRRTLACFRRWGKRRCHRQASRSALSNRQPRRHAEDQEISKRRLCHRRLPVRGKPSSGPQGTWVDTPRTLRCRKQFKQQICLAGMCQQSRIWMRAHLLKDGALQRGFRFMIILNAVPFRLPRSGYSPNWTGSHGLALRRRGQKILKSAQITLRTSPPFRIGHFVCAGEP